MKNFLWDTACPRVGELDEGAFRAGPELSSLSRRTPLWPNRLQPPGKQQKGPAHFGAILLLAFQ